MLDDDPQALYRTRAKDGTLLYIGKSNDPLRRAEEHRRTKDWMAYNAVSIDLEWFPDLRAVLDAEARAIRTEHPIYNVQHNTGRIRIEAGISAEVSTSGSPVTGIFVMGAAAIGLIMLGKWATDSFAVWRVRRMTERDGMPFEAPAVRNPFTENPPGGLQHALWCCLAAAATSGTKDDPKAMAEFTAWAGAVALPTESSRTGGRSLLKADARNSERP